MKKMVFLISFIFLFLLNGVAFAQLPNKFTNTARNTHYVGYAQGVAVAPDGTIFLAKGENGLKAYSFDGTSFTITAHIDNGSSANGVAVSLDGTIFLANGHDGLRAYSYDGSSFTNIGHIDDGGDMRGYAYGVAVAS